VKKILLSLALIVTPVFASAGTVLCGLNDSHPGEGELNQNTIEFRSIDPWGFSLSGAREIRVNIMGKSDNFSRNFFDVTVVGRRSQTLMKYSLVSDQSVEAVVTIDRSPGDAARAQFFQGQIEFAVDESKNNPPLFPFDERVYLFACRTNR
jgi:hypothetical protein